MFRPGHDVDHPSAGAEHPQELFPRKRRETVEQQVGPAGFDRLVKAGRHRIPGRGQSLGGQPHGGLGNIKPGQLQRTGGSGKLPRDAAVIPALAAACIQQAEGSFLCGGDAVFQAHLPQRLPEDAVIPGTQERAAGGHHLLAVAGGFRPGILNGQ